MIRRLVLALGRHRWFAGAASVATFGFAWLVTLGTFRLDVAEEFGSFYDYQAAAFLAGRLDVPDEAIRGEAFEAHGKLYGYFGPTPALLRLPFALTGVGFGKLSRALMLAYFFASLAASYLLLREALQFVRAADKAERDGPPSPFATVALVTAAGWGSTLFFLGSRGLIFHEAILSGVAFALWSAWCSLRHLRAPGGSWWIGALVGGVASVHCRPPTGLFALALLGVVALACWWRAGAARWTPPTLRRALLIGSLCALGQLSLNGLAWLKFRTFDPAPLAISRPYANPARLAAIEGKSFHAANIPYGAYTYLVRPNLRLESGFPWIYLEARTPGHYFPRAKIDLPDSTLALPWSMPGLFLLATLGGLAAAIACPATRAPLALLGLAVLPMSLALFAAVATAQRYTGDFCPWLIASAVFGLAALETAPPALRKICRVLALVATLAAVAVTVAITLHYQGAWLWGVPEETRVRYQALRRTVDAFLGVHAPPSPPTLEANPSR